METAEQANQQVNPIQITYPEKTVHRAARAVRCAPFGVKFYESMRSRSVAIAELVGAAAVQQSMTRSPLSELTAENELMWLIQVGMLRREVDGQGLTDRFRLTPLGFLLLDRWQTNPAAWTQGRWGDRLRNSLWRWGRWPL